MLVRTHTLQLPNPEDAIGNTPSNITVESHTQGLSRLSRTYTIVREIIS